MTTRLSVEAPGPFPAPSSPAPLRVALSALGCKVNVAEMAELAGVLAAAGLEVVGEEEQADVRVINTCAVTRTADATSAKLVRRLRRRDPHCTLVVTGCSVDAEARQPAVAGERAAGFPTADAVFANADKPSIARWILERARVGTAAAREEPPRTRTRHPLKIQDGCDHRCSYCIVWRTRGGVSRSLPPEEIVRRAEAAVEAGHPELVLCGIDLGSWGRDLRPRRRLHDLVALLLEDVGDRARIRLSSINVNDVTPELADLTGHPRFCSHWHLPIQSGSDSVLRAMRRGYRVAAVRRVVSWLRRADPDCEVTSDIMVGFPGETEDDHRATLELVEELDLLHCHVFRWSPWPGTPAASLPGRVDDATARRRSREVRAIAARCGARRRRRALGSIVEVVWEATEHGRAKGTSDRWFTVVAPVGPTTRLGTVSRVRLDAVEGETMRGTPLSSDARPPVGAAESRLDR